MAKPIGALVLLTLWGCGTSTEPPEAVRLSYALARKYTGSNSNALALIVGDGAAKDYTFSLHSDSVQMSVEQDMQLPLTSSSIDLTYSNEGVYSVDFKIRKANGEPYIYDVLGWEYSRELPDPPIISFEKTITNQLTNRLFVSDSRKSNTSEIWLAGDVEMNGTLDQGGYWQDLDIGTLLTPVTLTSGDGLKTVRAKFRNIYGNESEEGSQVDIFLKQTPPTGCDATALKTTVSSTKLTLKLNGKDTDQIFVSVTGDLEKEIDKQAFTDGDVIFAALTPTQGLKHITVYIEDVASNFCLEKPMEITVDPDYISERIDIVGKTYWSDTENVALDVSFDHFPSQEPLEMKITGAATGPNTNVWIPYQQSVAVSLYPTTSGSRTIFAQYKDAQGTESYQIPRRIFLKPTVTLENAIAPSVNVKASEILDAESLTVTGCVEVYSQVAYQSAYACVPNAAAVDVTYHFPDGTTLTKSATP